MTAGAVTAAQLGLVACSSCGQVARAGGPADVACPRCGARMQRRKADSLPRTTAFLVAAAVLGVPANLMPMITTVTLRGSHSDTILSGVVALWRAGSWALSLLIFAASIAVPALKIGVLTLLVGSTWLRSAWRRRERTRLYRLVELVGRWSLLDIFVMALLAALLRSRLAGVDIEAGAVAFAAAVVLTMLSSLSFDPRLIWDRGGNRHD